MNAYWMAVDNPLLQAKALEKLADGAAEKLLPLTVVAAKAIDDLHSE